MPGTETIRTRIEEQKEMSKEFTIEDLNAFLKTLRAGSSRLERLRAYVRRLEVDVGAVSSALGGESVKGGLPSSKVEKAALRLYSARERLARECDYYYRIEDRLTEVMNTYLNDEERDIIVSHYILGMSFDRIAMEKYLARATVFRWLDNAKEKIVKNWLN